MRICQSYQTTAVVGSGSASYSVIDTRAYLPHVVCHGVGGGGGGIVVLAIFTQWHPAHPGPIVCCCLHMTRWR